MGKQVQPTKGMTIQQGCQSPQGLPMNINTLTSVMTLSKDLESNTLL